MTTYHWTNAKMNDKWSDAGNWNPAGPPPSGDAASVAGNNKCVFDGDYPPPQFLDSLIVEGSGAGMNPVMTLEQSVVNRRMAARWATVGHLGQAVYIQSKQNTKAEFGIGGGDDALILGNEKDEVTGLFGKGTYTLDAGDLMCVGRKYTGALIVGNRGTGILNVNGGTVTANGVTVGASNVGDVFHKRGTVTVSSPYSLFLGRAPNALGRYWLTAAQGQTLLEVYGNIQLGYEGHGMFSQVGGTVNINGAGPNNGYLFIANATTASGTYDISGRGKLNVTGGIFVGGDASSAGGPAFLNVTNATVKGSLRVHRLGTVNIGDGGVVEVGCDPGDNIFNEGTINITGNGVLKLGGTIYGPGTVNGTPTPCP